jgi:hypothetical protein
MAAAAAAAGVVGGPDGEEARQRGFLVPVVYKRGKIANAAKLPRRRAHSAKQSKLQTHPLHSNPNIAQILQKFQADGTDKSGLFDL